MKLQARKEEELLHKATYMVLPAVQRALLQNWQSAQATTPSEDKLQEGAFLMILPTIRKIP
jgi:hypothetical protein